MKRTPLKRKTTLRAKKALRGHTSRSKASKPSKTKTVSKGYKVPAWFRSIPPGSHGNNIVQKRFWKLISDTFRKEDWEKYDGKCASCGKYIEHWSEGDCGHFKKYSVCNSWFKYERKNLALQCKGCNKREDGVVGHAFGETLKKRWGPDIIKWIETENEKYRGQKIEAWEYVEKAAKLRPDLAVDNQLDVPYRWE